jgi:predicted N-acyltransferase
MTTIPDATMSMRGAPAHHLAPSKLSHRVHASVTDIPREAWIRLYPSALHTWDFYRAAERMPAHGFSFSAVTVHEGDDLIAAAPVFRVEYRVDSALGDGFRKAGDWLERQASSMIIMPVLGLGSPLTDECEIGWDPELDANERAAAMGALVEGLADHAAETGVRVLVVKDLRDADRVWAEPVLEERGLSRVPSLPVAKLDLPFDNLDGYLASLSPKMRSDLRRKQRQSHELSTEFRDDIRGLEDEIEALYRQTRERRKASYDLFDELPQGYFREVVSGLGGRAKVLLIWLGSKLVGFNLFIVERDRVVGKHMGMRYPEARDLNVYFVNWLAMVRWCIEQGIRSIQVGQSSYVLKARLGCTLERSWIYARHTGLVRGPLFRMLAPLAAFDRFDPDLRLLGEKAPYAEPLR